MRKASGSLAGKERRARTAKPDVRGMENCIAWGTNIERGRIMTLDEEKYDVESIDRQGVRVFGLKAMGGGTYKVRDAVYFFVFDDGHGMILGKIE